MTRQNVYLPPIGCTGHLADFHDPATLTHAYECPIHDAASAPHVDYPHDPGYLFDCPACEASCHCSPGLAECVYDGAHNGTAVSECDACLLYLTDGHDADCERDS